MDQISYLSLPHDVETSWQIKKQLLIKVIEGCQKQVFDMAFLEQCMSQAYNERIVLDNLNHYYSSLSQNEQSYFNTDIIPFICNAALKIESLFKRNESNIQILMKQSQNQNELNREEILSLISNMFFFTITKQDISTTLKLPNYVNMRNILTRVDGIIENNCNIQKINCLMNYFKRMMQTSSEELLLKVIYKRSHFQDAQILSELEDEHSSISKLPLTELLLDDKGSIQDYEDKFECIQSDFADKYVGGGVLNKGCVQEEIMFIVAIELIPSILFCERLDDDEVIQISGAQRYSTYLGYGATFQFQADHISQATVSNQLNIKLTHFTLFDAMNFRNKQMEQYQHKAIIRELLKSYTAFDHFYAKQSAIQQQQQEHHQALSDSNKNLLESTCNNIPIVSGNWGCGIYSGDAQFKLVIQWISASILSKNVYYCTFGNPNLNSAQQVVQLLKDKTIFQVFQIIKQYSNHFQQTEFFTFLIDNISKQPQNN